MDSNLEHQDNELHYDGENAPLLSSGDSAAPRSNQKLSVATILALTCINGGLQVFFSTVMANLSVRMSTATPSHPLPLIQR